jgi:hypothetical protein
VEFWLKAVGHARRPLSERWLDERPELLHRTGFPAARGSRRGSPPVEAIGVAARSMSQQSHIRLLPDHYDRAVTAIASVAARPSAGPE